MDYIVKGNDIHIRRRDFDLAETLDCGQAFRWEKTDGGYSGYFLNRFLELEQTEDEIIFRNTSADDFEGVWTDYFDLDTDYSEIKRCLSQDKTLSEACAFAGGIRLLRQDAWEALCSFIISQNNNIPRIKGIINRMCEHYGGFPLAEQLASETEESLAFLRSGFRAKYIIDGAVKAMTGDINLNELAKAPIEDARRELMRIKGVGPKVAECVLLFGMHRTEAFPVDVWIKRVLAQYYEDGFPQFAADNAGIAQQYLFHYIRNKQ